MGSDRLAVLKAFHDKADPRSLAARSLGDIGDVCREHAQELFVALPRRVHRELSREDLNLVLDTIRQGVVDGFVAGARMSDQHAAFLAEQTKRGGSE